MAAHKYACKSKLIGRNGIYSLMLSYSTAFYSLLDILKPLYDEGEANAIAHEIMEHITGFSRLQRLDKKDELLTTAQQAQLDTAIAELKAARPLQYITGTAWFMGMPFKVNEHVLIPRPETEELVQWIVNDYKTSVKKVSLLDIGTGSGCIPISLKRLLPGATITSCDVSSDAIAVAKENARNLDADITIIKADFLDESQWTHFAQYDVIVSNPPYIPFSEKETLHANVLEHEPHLALFVPYNDALLFYRKIAGFGKTHLTGGGAIYCELHRDHAVATAVLFEQAGYSQVQMIKDMHGNNRMLKAIK